jgi:ATP adenylyltransferase
MPILASTMVLPELIPVTYAKLRAELGRELAGAGEATVTVGVVVLSRDRRSVLVTRSGALPAVTVEAGMPTWKAVAAAMRAWGLDATLATWAGPSRVAADEPVTLGLLADSTALPNASSPVDWTEISSNRFASASDVELIDQAIRGLSTLGG